MTSRKRRHNEIQKLQQYGIDLPDIPGVPVQVIPLHVQALRDGQKYFKACREAIPPTAQKSNDSFQTADAVLPGAQPPSKEADSLHQTLLNRVQQASTVSASETIEHQALTKLRNKHDRSVSSWIESLRRQIKDQKDNSKIVFATMEHLWDLATTHKKVSARRAALHMAGNVLSKSASARQWLLSGDKRALISWIDSLSEGTKILQQEAYMLLDFFEQKGYSSLYPTLGTALRKLEEAYSVETTECSKDTGMIELRKYRDLAMKYWEKETAFVNKLVQKIHTCTDILVPRMGQDNISSTDLSNDNASPNQVLRESDDDSDEEIDWEDGWEDENNERHEVSHADAVETTLAVMQTRAGGLINGSLEVNLNTTSAATPPDGDSHVAKARERLAKYSKRLQDSHMPRLRLWANGLTNADALTLNTSQSSLIHLSDEILQQRQHVLNQMLELKARVAGCLESAKNLGAIVPTADHSNVANDTAHETQRHQNFRPGAAVNLLSTGRHENLAARMSRARPRGGHRGSNRIRIKFGKS